MKSQLSWNNYKEQELSNQTAKQNLNLGAKLSDLWQRTLAYLSTSSEPYVWRTQAADQVVWNAYDPVSQTTIERVSADEMRSWLEERHYQAI